MKDIFIVNCATVNNIPFFQKIFSKFNIKYHVICDSDSSEIKENDEFGLIKFDSGIQKSIYQQFNLDYKKDSYPCGLFQIHEITFEPAHKCVSIPVELKYSEDFNDSDGKPFNANLFWKNILQPNLEHNDILKVPIINFIKNIVSH